eukprot:scaffold1004_cov269-Pinguiococcus_pyrenoidosus.AAC.1
MKANNAKRKPQISLAAGLIAGGTAAILTHPFDSLVTLVNVKSAEMRSSVDSLSAAKATAVADSPFTLVLQDLKDAGVGGSLQTLARGIGPRYVQGSGTEPLWSCWGQWGPWGPWSPWRILTATSSMLQVCVRRPRGQRAVLLVRFLQDHLQNQRSRLDAFLGCSGGGCAGRKSVDTATKMRREMSQTPSDTRI